MAKLQKLDVTFALPSLLGKPGVVRTDWIAEGAQRAANDLSDEYHAMVAQDAANDLADEYAALQVKFPSVSPSYLTDAAQDAKEAKRLARNARDRARRAAKKDPAVLQEVAA